jgi:hypothetical protein
MIIRKSNIMSLNWLLQTPTLRAVAWIDGPDNRRLAIVAAARDQEDFNRFIGHDVIIDGARHRCLEVRNFASGPYRRGDSVGIVVAGRGSVVA